jgi:chorismate synthase
VGNTFGRAFRVTTFGESHGAAVGVIVDGCPPRLPISLEEIQKELDRRRPGQSSIVTQRKESDTVEILSGVQDGVTLGTPIAMVVRNEDQRSRDYDEMRLKYRPSHADFAYDQKYGIRAWSGGGRASARETIGRVAAGAVAKKLLAERFGVEIVAWVEKVQSLTARVDPLTVSQSAVEANMVRCPDPQLAEQMIALIEAVRKEGDSIGGVVGCVARGVPAGWGEPVFDKLEADLAKALLSLPACKGFEIGGGFGMTERRGSEVNDEFYSPDATGEATPPQPPPVEGGGSGTPGGGDRQPSSPQEKPPVSTHTNNSGGVQGGISNGMPIIVRAAFKPTATIMHEQRTVTVDHENTTLKGRGRHDPCVLPRAVPIVEAMVALVLADHALRQAQNL